VHDANMGAERFAFLHVVRGEHHSQVGMLCRAICWWLCSSPCRFNDEVPHCPSGTRVLQHPMRL
jgi:hypothetical protein